MRPALRAAFVAACLACSGAWAEDKEPAWEGSATAYWNSLRGGGDYGSGIFIASRDKLHLEARVNYEARHAGSAFAGWTFSTGETVTLEARPIVGYAGGDVKGPIAGFEATVSWKQFDWYVEAEYVHDRTEGASKYTYAWSELGFRPIEPVRVGIVAQHTRAYGTDREVQRGGFAQFSYGKVTASVYWFNPGSDDQVVMGAIGFSF
jgi:hypothetical protein